jgi:hypothetical protein
MINRSQVVLGALAALAIVSAIGFGLMFMRLGNDCLGAAGVASGSCPSAAEVNDLRYSVSVARGVNVNETDVTPYAPIGRTNVPDYFTELQAYSLPGISPTAALVARSVSVLDEDDSTFRILWGPEQQSAFPALCGYFVQRERDILEGCGGVTPT